MGASGEGLFESSLGENAETLAGSIPVASTNELQV
jgi:hypothetical protein